MGECHSNENCCHPCHTPHEKSCEGHDKHDEFTKFFLAVADEAWTEVLKEKIKEHILATQGEKMKELAQIVSDANNQRWKHKMEKKHSKMDFKEKLSRFFGQSKK